MEAEADDTQERHRAKLMYWRGYPVAEIARQLDRPHSTVQSWKRRDDWDGTPVIQRVESSVEARLAQLIAREDKGESELREIDTLLKSMERAARIRRYESGGNEADLNPKVKNRNRAPKRKPRKNEITDDQAEQLRAAFEESLFDYQRRWLEAKGEHRIRNILKSRQIGATWYFAREAITDAAEGGGNQIFLSASKAQAHVFRGYIVQMVWDVLGVELKGDPITLSNGATLYFLGTNARTAQSYHGHVYMDEYFWIPRFQELRKVASGMAMHKQWRQTYISTPSAMTHEAYPFWSGEHFNRGRRQDERIELDVSHDALAGGRLCEDGQWRQVVTVEDAIAGGCDLFDLEQLKLEYSDAEYRNLLMCEFIDDTASVFRLDRIQAGMVDSWAEWSDFKPLAPRPLGERPVWIGYDPSRTRDDAAVAVVAPPVAEGGKFRVLERHSWSSMPFHAQADALKRIAGRYNVQHIGIDTTGIGYGVYDLVKQWFPAVRAISYSPQVKTRLVLRALEIIDGGRLEFDAGARDIAGAFMSIRQTTTGSGGQVTYQASRSEEHGHGDLAWAVMHALEPEPMGGKNHQNTGFMEIYG
ncbi:terminase large subunit domain-containing protein [Halorhodospira neutriphila]|uniref:Terminase, ATPase subunit n=1 Tax=Halorhodospira neutriphila TaxID=168379 RepID=A0ABS1E2J6_9GAMM|nr:terminase family protein [Halorhodospira neutriphila]MBK1725705.1 hypothetical protein [Halorhodospira neutriphila]